MGKIIGKKTNETCTIHVHTGNVILQRFGGVGFHVFDHLHNPSRPHLEQVIAKRWRELNPSFARVTDKSDWDRPTADTMAEHFLRMQTDTDTELYVTTWNPAVVNPGPERKEYARKTIDRLEYLIKEKGLTNIRHYCMSNELSLNGWGKMIYDLPTFKDYHRELHDEIRSRNLDIKLLSTDASPFERWHSIEWATVNMDDITDIYGGHNYINDFAVDDISFYPVFLSQATWGTAWAKKMNKDFIIGEFGCKQDGSIKNGIFMDRCVHFDTDREPMVGIQLAEFVVAAMNAGVYALGYWTFNDFPDPGPGAKRINKWGTFRWSGEDYSTRAHYYAYGLLTRFFRGPSTVLAIDCDDELVRTAVVQHHDSKSYSIAVINRNDEEIPVHILFKEDTAGIQPAHAVFRKYVYNPKNVPQNPFGDMQQHSGEVVMENGRMNDSVGPDCLTVYTTAYQNIPPARVKEAHEENTPDGNILLKWKANTEPDLCYYRIYRSSNRSFNSDLQTQIGSTINTEFALGRSRGGQEYYYKIRAVDKSGNTSEDN